MKKPNKNWIIAIILIAFTVIFTGYFLFKQRKYSISEITADNYRELLSDPICVSIDNVKIDDIIQKGGAIEGLMLSTYLRSNSMPLENDEKVSYYINDGGDTIIQIRDENRDLMYSIKRKFGFPLNIVVSKMFEFATLWNKDALKSTLSELILNHGFILYKSNFIDGHDILIREEEDCFRIVELAGKYENCTLFDILTYSRN